ncbi:protein PXR1-like [Cynara cardunculus var. scolymus]|uniref:protein PXR1-like n=1 Tax=Cynara cardunculus var. scolymus TaxID=59895 RepID=UPI000D62A233|nr:protein PXR1-like [Cynara cardunculus var. scolymus]
MTRVSQCCPFQSQRQTQPKSNTEGDDEDERKEESEGDDEEKGTSSSSSSDEKKKGKRPMKGKKRNQKYQSINEIKYGPGGESKGVVIRDRDAAKESDGGPIRIPPSARRNRTPRIEVKRSYPLRSREEDSEEKERKGKEKEQETDVWEANPDTDQKGKNIAEDSDDESNSSDPEWTG